MPFGLLFEVFGGVSTLFNYSSSQRKRECKGSFIKRLVDRDALRVARNGFIQFAFLTEITVRPFRHGPSRTLVRYVGDGMYFAAIRPSASDSKGRCQALPDFGLGNAPSNATPLSRPMNACITLPRAAAMRRCASHRLCPGLPDFALSGFSGPNRTSFQVRRCGSGIYAIPNAVFRHLSTCCIVAVEREPMIFAMSACSTV